MARIYTKEYSKDKVFMAYLAGFTDGEGCISVSRRIRNKEKGWYSFDPTLTIANSDLRVLKYIHKKIGFGCVRTRKQPQGYYTDKKQMHSYYVSNNQARRLIEDLLPYLIVKKEQAIVILTLPKRGKRSGDYSKIPDKERKEKQLEIFYKLKELKR